MPETETQTRPTPTQTQEDYVILQGEMPLLPLHSTGLEALGRCRYRLGERGILRWSQLTPWQLRSAVDDLRSRGLAREAEYMAAYSAYKDANPESILTKYNPPAATGAVE